MTSTIATPASPRRGTTAIALINLVFWSVVIGGYILIAEPLRLSGAPEVRLAQERLAGLLVAAAVAVGVVFLVLAQGRFSRGRVPLVLSLVGGQAFALCLIVVVNWVAAQIAYDSLATLGPTLSTVGPLGVALVATLLSAVSADRRRAGMGLAFGLGIGLGVILFLLNVTSDRMTILYDVQHAGDRERAAALVR